MGTLSEIKEAFNTVKDLYDRGLMQEAHGKLLELQDEILQLKEQSLEMREELLNLRTQLKQRVNKIYKEPFYYVIGEDGFEDGPFCQRCMDSEEKLARLIPVDHTAGSHRCTVCKTHYGKGTPPPKVKIPNLNRI